MSARPKAHFLVQSLKASIRYRSLSVLTDALGYYKQWTVTMEPGATPLHDGRPWITMNAISFLDGFLRPEFSVFEYGTGGSTVFFARRVARVVSVEHDKEWFARVKMEIEKLGLKNWEGSCVLPVRQEEPHMVDPTNPDHYISSDDNYKGQSFRAYVESIDAYPDSSFDVVLIDGRARPSCFKHAGNKVKSGGIIVWDNTEREEYWSAMQTARPSLCLQEFPGWSSYSDLVTRTSIWQRQR